VTGGPPGGWTRWVDAWVLALFGAGLRVAVAVLRLIRK